MFITAFHGFCMALADSVPGVSGGTVAFILGFYERLLAAIQHLLGRDPVARKGALRYLVKLGLGWVLGMGLSIVFLAKVFETNIYLLSSIFLGLTVAAIPLIIRSEKSDLVGKYQYLVFTLAGFALVAGLTFWRANNTGGAGIDYLALGLFDYLYLLLAGFVAIMAMILPGISGSTLLLIFAVYVPTVNAVKEVLHFNLAYLPGVVVFGSGILLGVAFGFPIVRVCLQKFRSQMIYLIVGLVIGSLYAIAMGPTTLEVPQSPLSLGNFSVIGFVIGIGLLVGLELMRAKLASADPA